MTAGDSEDGQAHKPPYNPSYRGIAGELRKEIIKGDFKVGDQLPTQEFLVRRFRVSRATIVRALDELREDGYIDSHQGRGSFVANRQRDQSTSGPAGVLLSDRLDAAFQRPDVVIDVFSLTCETLNGALQGPLQRIRSGELEPESVSLRLLLPARDAPLVVPRSTTDPADERPKQRFRRLATSQLVSIESSLESLRDLALVKAATVEVKTLAVTPLHKLYLLNGTEALFGYYEVEERPVRYQGADMDIYDVLGLGAMLFHFSAEPPGDHGQAQEIVAKSQAWFDSLWDTIAEPWEW